MNFVIPMAGGGRRFVDAGFREPKPLIVTRGKTLLQWSVDSLPLFLCTNLIFIILADHESEFKISGKILQWYGGRCNIDFVFLPGITRGQAETVLRAKHVLKLADPLLIYNIDTYFESKTLESALKRENIDGVLGSFKDNSPRFSFAKTGKDGFVTQVAEKEPIAANALTGLYHFSRAEDFIRVAEEAVKKNITTKGEFYVAPMYNKLIKEGKKFVLDFCCEFHILGTPEELGLFAGQNKSAIPNNRHEH